MFVLPRWIVACQLLLASGGCGQDGDSPSDFRPEARVVTPELDGRHPAPRPLSLPSPPVALSPLDPSNATVATDRFNSARVCGACHQDIFQEWSGSMHALSYTDPIFTEAFMRAFYYSRGEAAQLCLACHSPTVGETGDVFGEQELTREGVTCDYCHSISSLDEDARGQVRHTIDHATKYGPFELSAPSAHRVARRPHFERSEICAGCHDYTTAEGTVVFATYSEWRASKYAEAGRHCQDCHMPRLPASRTAPDGRTVFNAHDLRGGHSPAQIKRAVVARIEDATRDADRVRVVVAVENSGAGHSVPTGLPSRMLVLSVSATQRSREVFHQNIIYQRVMQDSDHTALTADWEIKLRSKRVLRDNRLRSGEVRRETFIFDASPREDVTFRVSVAYRYQPSIASAQDMEVPITALEQIIARGL